MLTYFATWYKGGSGSVYNISHYFTDVNGNLPSVVFIERGGKTGLDEHPTNNIQKGAADVENIINALMNSPNWGSSVFILTFDEGGGMYDHVPPAPMPPPDNIPPNLQSTDIKATFNQTGFRVPLIVVSPWVKPHLVSHTVRDYTSILKLIETRFGLPSLTARDAAADNMTEFFDFSAPSYPTAPTVAPQTTNGVCNFNLEKAPGF
jgi:phospholipase C